MSVFSSTALAGGYLVAGLLTFSVLYGCARTDGDVAPLEPEVGDSACVLIPPSANPFGYGYHSVYPQWSSGCYNPANGEEAAVVALEQDALTILSNRLYRLNLRTGQRTLLFDGLPDGRVAWSRTGWLAFTWSGEVWKIKADGDSLTPLTSGPQVHIAECWSPDGRYVVSRRSSGMQTAGGIAIHTAAGAFVRLLPDVSTRAYPGTIDWSPDGRRLAYVGGPGTSSTDPRLCLYDLTTDQLDTLDVLPSGSSYFRLRWLPNGTEVVWDGPEGISLTNVTTGRTRLVRTHCPGSSRGLSMPDVSPDGQQLLMGRSEFRLTPGQQNYITERYWLETCNLRGTQIRRVTP